MAKSHPVILAQCEKRDMFTTNLQYFHNQMPKPNKAPPMALAVVVSWYRTLTAMDQRLPY